MITVVLAYILEYTAKDKIKSMNFGDKMATRKEYKDFVMFDWKPNRDNTICISLINSWLSYCEKKGINPKIE